MDHRLNIKYETIKLLKDNIRENLGGLSFCNDLLDKIPKHNPWSKKKKNWKIGLHFKLKFSSIKGNVKRMRRWARLGAIVAKHISDKGLCPR